MAFGRLEPKERAASNLSCLGSASHLHAAVDNEHPSVLVHLMLTELLARLENDEDRPRTVVLMHHDRVARSLRRLDLE
jgi:hypothetical protein